MAVIVLSVPHTGTRTLCHFLDRVGVIYRQYHSEPNNLEDLRYEIKNRAIAPIRDPLLCFASTLARNGLTSFETVLSGVVLSFELLIGLEQDFNIEYIDTDEKGFDKYQTLHKSLAAQYPIPNDLETVVGNIKAAPTSYETWGLLAKALGEDKAAFAIDTLKEVRAHYGY